MITAVGLEWSDLFPPSDRNYRAEKRHIDKTVDELVIEIAMADMAAGKSISDSDAETCREAIKRVDAGKPSPVIERDVVKSNSFKVAKRESLRVKKAMEAWT